MGKSLHNDTFDAMLNYIANNGDKLCVCSAEPTTYTQAVTTYELADVTLTKGAGNGDYTIGDGDVSGRKLAVAEQANIDVDVAGTATHIAIVDVSNTKLLLVTTCVSQAVSAGGKVTIQTFDCEVGDPT